MDHLAEPERHARTQRALMVGLAFSLVQQVAGVLRGGCAKEEHDVKHKIVRQLSGTRTATGAVGMSEPEFHQYLPGLYWLTVFGKELVEHFGKPKLMSLPDVVVTELENDQLAVRLSEPVVPDSMERRLEAERRLADILGPQFFFDRSRHDVKLEPVPALLKSLNELRRG